MDQTCSLSIHSFFKSQIRDAFLLFEFKLFRKLVSDLSWFDLENWLLVKGRMMID